MNMNNFAQNAHKRNGCTNLKFHACRSYTAMSCQIYYIKFNNNLLHKDYDHEDVKTDEK